MAEFSSEYYTATGIDMISDFSYLTEFESLKENESFMEICEGLGVYGIIRLNDVPHLFISRDNKVAPFSEFIENFKKIKHDR